MFLACPIATGSGVTSPTSIWPETTCWAAWVPDGNSCTSTSRFSWAKKPLASETARVANPAFQLGVLMPSRIRSRPSADLPPDEPPHPASASAAATSAAIGASRAYPLVFTRSP
nr:hypothetical protein [Actinomadura madurae]